LVKIDTGYKSTAIQACTRPDTMRFCHRFCGVQVKVRGFLTERAWQLLPELRQELSPAMRPAGNHNK
jgi:hypothetical protein